MKVLLITFISLVNLQLLIAEQNAAFSPEKCRPFLENINPELPQSEVIRIDLVQSNWSDARGQWSFQEDGSAQLVEEKQSGAYTYEAYRWDLRNHGADPVLYLQPENTRKTERFFVEQTCAGISLTNVEDLSGLDLEYRGPATARRMIVGHWENGLDQEELQQFLPHLKGNQALIRAKLFFDFNADGTFERQIISARGGLLDRAQGSWLISKDGQFLLLEQGNDRHCIPIQYLQLDELVLRQVLPARSEAAPSRGMYFNKL